MPEKSEKRARTAAKGSAPEQVEGTNVRVPEAGKGELNDEMLPDKGQPVPQEETGGNESDRSGSMGEMHPETAATLEKQAKEK